MPHLHIHLIPRYTGDAADPRGGVRWVMPGKARYWWCQRGSQKPKALGMCGQESLIGLESLGQASEIDQLERNRSRGAANPLSQLLDPRIPLVKLAERQLEIHMECGKRLLARPVVRIRQAVSKLAMPVWPPPGRHSIRKTKFFGDVANVPVAIALVGINQRPFDHLHGLNGNSGIREKFDGATLIGVADNKADRWL